MEEASGGHTVQDTTTITCEDGELCVCETHTVNANDASSSNLKVSDQNSEEVEFPLLPEIVKLELSISTENDYVQELRALKLQVEKKRKGDHTLDDFVLDSSQGEYTDTSQSVDSTHGEYTDTSQSVCNLNNFCVVSTQGDEVDGDLSMITMKENSDDNGSKSDNVRTKGPNKKRKCGKDGMERRRSKRNSLTRPEQTESVPAIAGTSSTSEQITTDSTCSPELPSPCSPRKRARVCQKEKSSVEHTKVSNKKSNSRVKKSIDHSKCSSDSETSKTIGGMKKQSKCANKNPTKRGKKANATNKAVSKICRSRSVEKFEASASGAVEEPEVNVGYDLKFPSPEKVGSQSSEAGSLLNLSLPTPTGGMMHSDSCSDFKDLSNGSISSDSDDDLPEGLTPIRDDDKPLAAEELVWAKYRTSYYFPAIVKLVYKKKRKVTLIWFNPDDPGLTMMSKNVLPFLCSKKDEILKAGEQLRGKEKEDWRRSMDRLDEFLSKMAQKELNDVWSFFKPEELQVGELVEEEETEKPAEEKMTTENQIRSLSKKGKLRLEHLSKKSKPLTDFLISDDTKEYLRKIFLEQVPSHLHSTFKTGSVKEKMQMKHRGFGPIDDETQIETILDTYLKWLTTWNNSPYLHKVNYIFDVWVPEAVVNALVHLRSYSKKRAWEMFEKGVRRTKEELQLIHEDLIRKTDDEDESGDGDSNMIPLTFKPKKLIMK